MDFTTPYGRLVQGHPMIGQDKDKDGKPYVAKSGKNIGQPITKFFCAMAFPKLVDYGDGRGLQPNREFAEFYAKMDSVARASFPHLFPPNGTGQCVHPRFAWKLSDGDGVDSNGKLNNTKEGWAGHWIVKFNTTYAPRCFHKDRYDPSQQIQNRDEIKTGYFCRISGSMDGNGVAANSSEVPGLYLNLNLFELSFYGTEIVSGPDAGAAFGGTNSGHGPLPPGATATPIGAASAAPALPAMPGATTGPVLPGAGPALPAVAGAAPSLPPVPGAGPALPAVAAPAGVPGTAPGITPNASFVAGAIPAQAAALPPMPATASVLTLTGAAVQAGYTLEIFRANGWNDDQIIAGGWAIKA